MPTPPRIDPLATDPLFLAYLDLYSRHRALMAVLAERGLGPFERLEADAEMWMEEHRETLVREALPLFRAYVVQLAQPPADDPPPASGRAGTPPTDRP